MSEERPLDEQTIAVLGGTGPQGRGLARRFAAAGLRVVIGSRTAERAESIASDIVQSLAGSEQGAEHGSEHGSAHGADRIRLTGAGNADAAAAGDIVLVVVPWDGHADLLRELAPQLAGKLVVDCVNPLGFDKQGPFALAVEEGSATEQAQALLPDSTVVGAFHNLSATLLEDPARDRIETDVLVLGDEREATDLVEELANRIPGVRGLYAGRRRNAHQVEALTANLIAINRRNKAHAGVRITDVG